MANTNTRGKPVSSMMINLADASGEMEMAAAATESGFASEQSGRGLMQSGAWGSMALTAVNLQA